MKKMSKTKNKIWIYTCKYTTKYISFIIDGKYNLITKLVYELINCNSSSTVNQIN